MSDPKFPLYSDAKCVTTREELVGIRGLRVGIIDRRQKEDGSWEYTVSPSKGYELYICDESELVHAEPRTPFTTDEEITFGLVALTAEFRYRICWAGGRLLLAQLGIDPMQCILMSCEQGFDVFVMLMLSIAPGRGFRYRMP